MLQQHGIEAPAGRRGGDPEIAFGELHREEVTDAALGEDGGDAGEAERDAGETLACGTGACAAVASGIRLGLLDPEVQVDTRGGRLTIAWSGQEADSVFMTGPATTVFEGQIDIPDAP